jgi:starvation-inducible DNA-binding protein
LRGSAHSPAVFVGRVLLRSTSHSDQVLKGTDFYQLHELYDELAETLLAHVDTIAERAVQLDGAATGTARMAANATRIEDFSAGPVGSMESVRMLVDRYAEVAKTTREAIDKAEEAKDMDTSDLFIDVSLDLDKALWYLEAHLQREE